MDGKTLSQQVRQKADEFKRLCGGIDEATASRAPEGRWSPKEIVSHLIGREGGSVVDGFTLFLTQDTPRIDLDPGNSHFSGIRAEMTFSQLLAQFDREYGKVADFVAGLSPEQLERKAYIPALKESPFGEYPTLATFVGILADHHLGSHVDHMREILQGLGALPVG